MSQTTNKGGKTLLTPTQYATKMALIDACFRKESGVTARDLAIRVFNVIKARNICFRPPPQAVVQNTFIKILDIERDGTLPFKQTIAYREFVIFSGGELEVALDATGIESPELPLIENLFWHVNSIGKRGSFWQCVDVRQEHSELRPGFTATITGELHRPESFGVVQLLDDFGEDLCSDRNGFNRISTYGEGTINLDKHRVFAPSAIPYRRRSAGKRFTWYDRVV
jgi:hypothetical protein